jgi:uncharacterized protein YukE
MADWFAVELDNLELVATSKLPGASADLSEAFDEVRSTVSAETEAFDGAPFNDLGDSWDSVRKAFEDVLDRDSQNLEQCAKALKQVVDKYRMSDTTAMRRLTGTLPAGRNRP